MFFHRTFSACLRLPNETSIFTAETYAILHALRQGLKAKKDFTIFTDSYSCLTAINNLSEHPLLTRILIILRHSSLVITLCYIPSHCNVFGNDQADRMAKRAINSHNIVDLKVPKIDLMKQVKRRIVASWQSEFNQTPLFKIKDTIGHWITCYNKSRKNETVLARLRLNCTKEIHLVPRIEGTFPLHCPCDGSRLSLHHIFFDCGYYIIQRSNILSILQNDRRQLNLKTLFEDNQKYCDAVLRFLKLTDLIDKI